MNIKLISIKTIKKIGFLTITSLFLLNACNGKLPGGDARKFPVDPKQRVKQNLNESIKISIRFLTNEIRSDALDIKVFNRKCENSLMNCKIQETNKVLVTELKKQILKQAAIYEKGKKDKNFKPYKNQKFGIE